MVVNQRRFGSLYITTRLLLFTFAKPAVFLSHDKQILLTEPEAQPVAAQALDSRGSTLENEANAALPF